MFPYPMLWHKKFLLKIRYFLLQKILKAIKSFSLPWLRATLENMLCLPYFFILTLYTMNRKFSSLCRVIYFLMSLITNYRLFFSIFLLFYKIWECLLDCLLASSAVIIITIISWRVFLNSIMAINFSEKLKKRKKYIKKRMIFVIWLCIIMEQKNNKKNITEDEFTMKP